MFKISLTMKYYLVMIMSLVGLVTGVLLFVLMVESDTANGNIIQEAQEIETPADQIVQLMPLPANPPASKPEPSAPIIQLDPTEPVHSGTTFDNSSSTDASELNQQIVPSGNTLIPEDQKSVDDALRIGTFNAQFFSVSETLGENPCCDNIPDRASKLADRIKASGYDIIVLNEVFDEDAKDELAKQLSDEYRYFIFKLDVSSFVYEDSGLMLFSRFPFEELPNDTYKVIGFPPPGGPAPYAIAQSDGAIWYDVAFIPYCLSGIFCAGSTCDADDCLAFKGVGYVRIRNPDTNRIYNVVFTHLQAKNGRPIRPRQLEIVEKLIKGTMTTEQIENEDIFFLGDMNINGDLARCRQEWDENFGDGTLSHPGCEPPPSGLNNLFFKYVLHDTWEYEMQPNLAAINRDRGLTGGIINNPPAPWIFRTFSTSTAPLAIAFGNIDGDEQSEFGVAGHIATADAGFFIFDDENSKFSELFLGGSDWLPEYTATTIAFGDVDGDGRDEIGVVRKRSEAIDAVAQFFIYDDRVQDFSQLHQGGGDWPIDYEANAIAFGDVDGDGRDEVGLVRNADGGSQLIIYDDSTQSFAELFNGIYDIGPESNATDLAFGDVDGDGRDEIGVSRDAGVEARLIILDDSTQGFSELYQGGRDWNAPAWSIAFGDVDGDGRDEVGVAGDPSPAAEGAGFLIYDDAFRGFSELFLAERGWSTVEAWDVAFGDVDGDGLDEAGVAWNHPAEIFRIYDDFSQGFAPMYSNNIIGSRAYYGFGNSIAFGDVTSEVDGKDELGIISGIITPKSPPPAPPPPGFPSLELPTYINIISEDNLTITGPRVDRLDYMLRNATPPVTGNGSLCVQHMTIAYNLRDGAPYVESGLGYAGIEDLSDHYGLNADINLQAPYCSPYTANRGLRSDQWFTEGQITYPGSMQWFYIQSPGTYSISLRGNDSVDFQVYKSTDLTAPIPKYGSPTHGWTFNVPDVPLYIRVFAHDRTWHGSYQLMMHQHQGRSPSDAIILSPNLPIVPRTLPPNETIWFRFTTEAPDTGQAQDIRIYANVFVTGDDPIEIEIRDDDSETIIGRSTSHNPQIPLNNEGFNNKQLFLLVRPNGFHPDQFQIGWETNLSVLYGSLRLPLKMQSIEQIEGGVDADDNNMKLTLYSDYRKVVDGVVLMEDWDEGRVRGLGDVFQVVRFIESVTADLVEDDGVQLRATIRPIPVHRTGPDPSTIMLYNGSEDGRYRFYYNLSHGLEFSIPSQVFLVDAGPDQVSAEGETITLPETTFHDFGLAANYTATIEWGDGSPIEMGTIEELEGEGMVFFDPHIYGDNGEFVAEICVIADGIRTACDSVNVSVSNVAPSANIDLSGAAMINGVPVFFGHEGMSVDFIGQSTDPGSDDLTLRWDWGDGSPITDIINLVNPPDPDPYPSPSVQPRDVLDMQAHTFSPANLYTIEFWVEDDDGGVSSVESVVVIVTGNAGQGQNFPTGYWQHQLGRQGHTDLDESTLMRYLSIVDFLSSVFNEERDASTIKSAYDVLFMQQNQGDPKEQFDRELLTLWLNLANGGLEYQMLVDIDGDHNPNTPLDEPVAEAEAVRLNPDATDREIREWKNILHQIQLTKP